MLNILQENILTGTLRYIFADIDELKLSEQKIRAFNAMLAQNVSSQDVVSFKRLDVWDDTIKRIRDIFAHPCPQNRTTGSPYVWQEYGMVVWKNEEGVICREPLGIMSLSSKNDTTADPVTAEDVKDHIEKRIKEKLAQYPQQNGPNNWDRARNAVSSFRNRRSRRKFWVDSVRNYIRPKLKRNENFCNPPELRRNENFCNPRQFFCGHRDLTSRFDICRKGF